MSVDHQRHQRSSTARPWTDVLETFESASAATHKLTVSFWRRYVLISSMLTPCWATILSIELSSSRTLFSNS